MLTEEDRESDIGPATFLSLPFLAVPRSQPCLQNDGNNPAFKMTVGTGQGSFHNKGVKFVATTFFEPTDYKQFLRGSWEGWPFEQMETLIVT